MSNRPASSRPPKARARPALRHSLRLLLGVAILAAALLAPRPTHTARAAENLRIRIGVVKDGIVRITPADLAGAGINVGALDPRLFALSSRGNPVAIQLTGAEDGKFDANDVLKFFGQRFRGDEMSEKYTDENVYWLTTGGPAGPRIADIDATPTGTLPTPMRFTSTVRAEDNQYWFSLHTIAPPSKDTWFWAQLQPTGTNASQTVDLPYVIPYPSATSPAQLTLVENARSAVTHRTTAALNGATIIDEVWSGKTRREMTASVPAGLLVNGANTLRVAAINPPGTPVDWMFVNYWELEYQRLFRAWQGQLDFTVEQDGPHEYATEGWTSTSVAVWDITDPLLPVRLINFATEPSNTGYRVRFAAADQPGDRFWLQEPGQFAAPASLRVVVDAGLRAPGRNIDAVIVTTEALEPAALELAAWHESQGRHALVAIFAEVVDEFNDGIYNPIAVPKMLSWAQTNWPSPAPHYLTLVGDGHWNFKGYNPELYPPAPNHIPPYLAFADYWQGEVPVDNRYADLDGDLQPDLAVGRLAVETLAQANAVVDKIRTYDATVRTKRWQYRALYISDNPDIAGDFPAVSDQILADYMTPGLQTRRIYLGETVADANVARTQISQALTDGALFVQYTGHGAPTRWAGEEIWRTTDVGALANGPRLPVVMTFNCLDGYFVHPDPAQASMAETMQRFAGGGSIAAISPTGLGTTNEQDEFRRLLLDELFKEDAPSLGDALLIAKQHYFAKYGTHYLIDTVTLFGDPALRFPTIANNLFLPSYAR